MNTKDDKFILGGHEFTSRFILGSGKFSLDLVKACIEKAEAQIITLALRRANEGGLANILDYIPDNVTLLPNTSGPPAAWNASDYKSKRPALSSRPFHFYSSSRNRAALSMAAAAFLMGNI